ncbi:MAG: lactonase family protein [Candidatus Korobacteraceae bacterium]|jgi:6-phosphogluconolactonase (cycloisomerase 2 family)
MTSEHEIVKCDYKHGELPRRAFLKSAAGVIAASAASGLISAFAEPSRRAQGSSTDLKPKFAYVGCYTNKERHGHGKGINVYRIEPSGEWTQIQLLEILSPSFLALDRRQRFLYSVHGDGTFVSSYSVDQQTGQIKMLNQQATGGKNSVHLSIDPSNRFLITANYDTGALTTFQLQEDGAIGPMRDSASLPGPIGPNRFRQGFSHPHHVPFDPSGRFIIVPDLGLDRIFTFRIDSNGKLIAGNPPFVEGRSASGPRHVAFHPTLPNAYVLDELNATMTTYKFNSESGELKPLQVVPMLPDSYTGQCESAELVVAPSGKFVYGSNRGHDSITTLSVDQETGLLKPIGWELTQGETPRFFALSSSGADLYACNQDSDTIVFFRVDQQTGKLTPSGQVVKTGSPVCIVFA